MSKSDPEKRRERGEPGNSPDDNANDTSAIVNDLDMLAKQLTRLKNRISGQVSTGLQDTGMADAPEKPESSKHPSIIVNGWRSAESPPSQIRQDELNDPGKEADSRPAEVREYMDAVNQSSRLNKERQQSRQQDAGNDCDKGLVELKDEHNRNLEETRCQSARIKAYALHAAGKFDAASKAYQDYFDLLGNESDDVSTLKESRECMLQAERIRKRARRTWTLSVLFVVLFGTWVGCTVFFADRTAERAQWAAENADMAGLRIYCDRLDSKVFSIGSLGMVGYLYGPAISNWRNRIDEAAQIPPEVMPVTTNCGMIADGSADAASDAADEPVEPEPVVVEPVVQTDQTDLSADLVSKVVVTNYLIPPIVSLGLAPRNTEAVIYDSTFEKMEMNYSVSVLEHGERYLLVVGKEGYEPYLSPMTADWEGVKRIEVALARPGRNGTEEPRIEETVRNKVYNGKSITMDELSLLMERYERRLLRRKLRALDARREE